MAKITISKPENKNCLGVTAGPTVRIEFPESIDKNLDLAKKLEAVGMTERELHFLMMGLGIPEEDLPIIIDTEEDIPQSFYYEPQG